MSGIADPLEHGGMLADAIARHGGEASQWLDLSTGISPFSLPLPDIPAQSWRRLPEPSQAEHVCGLAMKHYGGAVMPLAVPGSQAAIQSLPCLTPSATRVAIIGPTYGEYARAYRRAGLDVDEIETLEAAAHTRAGAVVLANPNNPDGRETVRDDVFGFVRAHRDRLVIVDEAFADMRQDLSMAGAAGAEPNLVVLRSFGKFFGLAGLRLGFVFAEPRLRAILSDRLGPWAVSGPALAIAAHAFTRLDLISDLRSRMGAAHAMTRSALKMAGLPIIADTPLFFFCEAGDGAGLRDALGERQVLIRAFEHSPTRVRIGLVRDELSAVRLREALRAGLGAAS